MNKFTISDCKLEYVVQIKRGYKQAVNNPRTKELYAQLIGETKTAISNIERCLENSAEQQTLLGKIRQGDTSFIDSILGHQCGEITIVITEHILH